MNGQVLKLRNRNKQLEQDYEECFRLSQKLMKILRATAAALKGKPRPGVWHDLSDLPKVAADLKAQRDEARKIAARGADKTFAQSTWRIIDDLRSENATLKEKPRRR